GSCGVDRPGGRSVGDIARAFAISSPLDRAAAPVITGRSGRIGVVKRSAVGTGPLRRSPAVHSQPIDLVVFQEPSHEKSCWKPRLEEGFALRCLQRYPFPTWLPGGAPSGTAGTPE